jgi:hypothetical protein
MYVRRTCVWGIAALGAVVAIPRGSVAQATDQWQAHLANGDYVYELTPRGLRGDTAVFVHNGAEVTLPLRRIDELRRIHKSFKHGSGGPRAVFGGLAGADDEVFQLTLASVAEKRAVFQKILGHAAKDSTAAHAGAAPRS